jgi:hypothetical protein
MAEKDKLKWDATIKKLTFEPGDMVMLTHEGRFGLEPRFKGPYIVTQVHPDYGTYKLETLAGEPLKALVHVDRLRPARGDRPDKPWYNPTEARREYNDIMKDNSMKSSNQELDIANKNMNEGETVTNYGQLLDPVDHIDPLEHIEDMVADNDLPATTLEAKDEASSQIISNPYNAAYSVPNELSDGKIVATNSKLSKTEVKPSADPSKLPLEIPPTNSFDSQTGSGVSSVPGRTQSSEGGNVEPMDTIMQDVPVHLEINLRKANKRKRQFKPSIPNIRRRKV